MDFHGAVSEETVKEMVENLLDIYKVDYGVAVSGIAGPGGGSEEKPVGTVWVAVSNKQQTITQCFSFGTGRERVFRQASVRALLMLYQLIKS